MVPETIQQYKATALLDKTKQSFGQKLLSHQTSLWEIYTATEAEQLVTH